MKQKLLLTAAGLIAAGACTGKDSSHKFTVSVRDGIEIAVTEGGPKYTQELFRYEKVLTLKENHTLQGSVLYNPGAIYRDRHGFYYVVDNGDLRIAVFNEEGEYVRSFGGEGAGPGEFRTMRPLYLQGDILSIYDSQMIRTTNFRTDGRLLWLHTGLEARPGLGAIHSVNGDVLIYEVSSNSRSQSVDLDKNFSWNRAGVVITEGANDTLAILNTQWVKTMYRVPYRGGMASSRMAYSGRPHAVYVPDRGIVMTTGVEPEVKWYSLDGKLQRTIRIEMEPVPITATDRDSIRQDLRKTIERAIALGRPGGTMSRLEGLRYHKFRAFWEWIKVDDAGYLWLAIPENSHGLGGRLNRVISPVGEYLGDSRWPATTGTVSGGLFLCMVSIEETGERLPTVFRIIPNVAGLSFP